MVMIGTLLLLLLFTKRTYFFFFNNYRRRSSHFIILYFAVQNEISFVAEKCRERKKFCDIQQQQQPKHIFFVCVCGGNEVGNGYYAFVIFIAMCTFRISSGKKNWKRNCSADKSIDIFLLSLFFLASLWLILISSIALLCYRLDWNGRTTHMWTFKFNNTNDFQCGCVFACRLVAIVILHENSVASYCFYIKSKFRL